MTTLTAKALLWRNRRPSGRFILHRIRCDHWCQRHGPVTRFHTCAATCAAGGWACLPGCSEAECGKTGVAA